MRGETDPHTAPSSDFFSVLFEPPQVTNHTIKGLLTSCPACPAESTAGPLFLLLREGINALSLPPVWSGRRKRKHLIKAHRSGKGTLCPPWLSAALPLRPPLPGQRRSPPDPFRSGSGEGVLQTIKTLGDPIVWSRARICRKQKCPFLTVRQRPPQAGLALAAGSREGGKQQELRLENTLPGPEFLPSE